MLKKEIDRIRRHKRLRRKVVGTSERPRLSVHRSLSNLYLQVIDDNEGKTLASFSTRLKTFKTDPKKPGKTGAAQKLGELFGKQLIEKGIQKVAFDRGGNLYHGRIKALAEALRQTGVQV